MTAFTLIETLSRVMTSWGGTCSAVTRMSMMTMRSMKGMIHLRPAVRTPTKRPSRSTTPCSYSLMMRSPMASQPATRATGMSNPRAGMCGSPLRAGPGLHSG